MSKYVRGSIPIGPDVASKLIAAFPREERPELLVAFLRDQIPDGFEHLVTLLPNVGPETLREDPHDPMPGMEMLKGPKRELIAYFAWKVIDDQAVEDWLSSMRTVLER